MPIVATSMAGIRTRFVLPLCCIAFVFYLIWGSEQRTLDEEIAAKGGEGSTHAQTAKASSVKADANNVPRQLTTITTGLTIQSFMYGTAWKKEKTKDIVSMAIDAGFRAIDTANQQKHYSEALVGEALQNSYSAKGLKREDFFLQTKYSHGQWRDSSLSYTAQVQESLKQVATEQAMDFYSAVEPFVRSPPLPCFVTVSGAPADRLPRFAASARPAK
jgi:hypothetical protein